jgi:hypothetical protein
VLLLVLWVRSYWWQDFAKLQYTTTDCIQCFSLQGRIVIQKRGFGFHGKTALEFTAYRLPGPVTYQDDNGQTIGSGWFHIMRYADFNEYVIPDWSLVATSATLAAAIWIHWSNRFSLRTLLIATTLVAVVLGLIVWTSRA